MTLFTEKTGEKTNSLEKKVWTDEEFMALPQDGHRYELVDEELVDIGNSGNDTRLLWVIHPNEKHMLIYHSPEPERFLRPHDSLEGEEVIPGFAIDVAELFEEWDF